jgi:type IV secretion system protein VirB10
MSTPATPPPTGPNKADPDTMALRASPRPVTRLNRRMLAVLAGTLGAVVLGGTLWSLQSHKRERNAGSELYNVDRVSHAENLDQLPKDYSKVPVAAKPVPVLGEPLPGDLSPAIVAQRNAGAPAQAGRTAQPGDAEEAAHSGVFFRSGAVKSAPLPTANSAMPEPASGNQPFNPMAPAVASAQPTDPTSVQNRQDQKQAFVANGGDTATRNPASLQLPASPYQVMAGTIIPAALVTDINSDLP